MSRYYIIHSSFVSLSVCLSIHISEVRFRFFFLSYLPVISCQSIYLSGPYFLLHTLTLFIFHSHFHGLRSFSLYLYLSIYKYITHTQCSVFLTLYFSLGSYAIAQSANGHSLASITLCPFKFPLSTLHRILRYCCNRSVCFCGL